MYIMKTSNIYYIDIDPNYPVKMFFKTEKRLFAAGIFLCMLNTLIHIVLYKYRYINDFYHYVRNIHYLSYIYRPLCTPMEYYIHATFGYPFGGIFSYTFVYEKAGYMRTGYTMYTLMVDLVCTIYRYMNNRIAYTLANGVYKYKVLPGYYAYQSHYHMYHLCIYKDMGQIYVAMLRLLGVIYTPYMIYTYPHSGYVVPAYDVSPRPSLSRIKEYPYRVCTPKPSKGWDSYIYMNHQ